MRKKGNLLFVSMFIIIFMCFFNASVSFAATSMSVHHNGGFHRYGPTSGVGVTSVYMKIYTPYTYPTVGIGSFSCAWPMIAGEKVGTMTNQPYVQVGWTNNNQVSNGAGEPAPEGVHCFFEYNGGSAASDHMVFTTYGPARGTTHTYRVQKEGSNYVGYVDSTLIDTWPAGFQGTEVHLCEEIDGSENWESAYFAGTSTDNARFSDVQVSYNNTPCYSPSLQYFLPIPGNLSSHQGLYTGNYIPDRDVSALYLYDLRT